eukprot:1482852-Pleurochrysis_carterae.AAC.1
MEEHRRNLAESSYQRRQHNHARTRENAIHLAPEPNEWKSLKTEDERHVTLDGYASLYLLLLRHNVLPRKKAFRRMLRVFFQLASSPTTSEMSAPITRSRPVFSYSLQKRTIHMELQSTSHLDPTLLPIMEQISKDHFIIPGMTQDILGAFAIRKGSINGISPHGHALHTKPRINESRYA